MQRTLLDTQSSIRTMLRIRRRTTRELFRSELSKIAAIERELKEGVGIL